MSDIIERDCCAKAALVDDYRDDNARLQAERDRLRAERDDWRDTAEDGWKMMRAENERLRDERDQLRAALHGRIEAATYLQMECARLRAALSDMIAITQRNSEAGLMLTAIRECAKHALTGKERVVKREAGPLAECGGLMGGGLTGDPNAIKPGRSGTEGE